MDNLLGASIITWSYVTMLDIDLYGGDNLSYQGIVKPVNLPHCMLIIFSACNPDSFVSWLLN